MDRKRSVGSSGFNTQMKNSEKVGLRKRSCDSCSEMEKMKSRRGSNGSPPVSILRKSPKKSQPVSRSPLRGSLPRSVEYKPLSASDYRPMSVPRTSIRPTIRQASPLKYTPLSQPLYSGVEEPIILRQELRLTETKNKDLERELSSLQIKYNDLFEVNICLQNQLNQNLPELRQATSLEQSNNGLAMRIKELQANEERMREQMGAVNKERQEQFGETEQFRYDVAYLTQEAERLLLECQEQQNARIRAED